MNREAAEDKERLIEESRREVEKRKREAEKRLAEQRKREAEKRLAEQKKLAEANKKNSHIIDNFHNKLISFKSFSIIDLNSFASSNKGNLIPFSHFPIL